MISYKLANQMHWRIHSISTGLFFHVEPHNVMVIASASNAKMYLIMLLSLL